MPVRRLFHVKFSVKILEIQLVLGELVGSLEGILAELEMGYLETSL
jgi:hypothetical protein